MERTEREQVWESWAGFQIRTSFPGRHWLPHSCGQILRTSSPVVKIKIIAKLIGRAKCRSHGRAGVEGYLKGLILCLTHWVLTSGASSSRSHPHEY
jgi:hypothetical protein